MVKTKQMQVMVSDAAGAVTAEAIVPAKAKHLWVLGHGAGAGMQHPFMVGLSEALAKEGVASWRFQFPYMERNRKRPDPAPLLQACVRANYEAAHAAYPKLSLFAGGKSMGGRMAVQAHNDQALAQVKGFIFVGYPLFGINGGAMRDAPLRECDQPMLFVQGARDKLAPLPMLEPVCQDLRALATLHVIPYGDHSLSVPKKSGKTPEDILAQSAGIIAQWMQAQV